MPIDLTRWILIALVALGGACAGVGARAQTDAPIDVECAWAAMPQDARDALLSVAPDPQQMGTVAQAHSPAIEAAAKQCHLDLEGDGATRFGKAITAKLLEVWAAGQLSKLANVDAAALDRTWASLPPAERASIGHEVEGGLVATPAEKLDLRNAAASLGVHDDAGLKYVAYYFAARALLAAYTGRP